MQNFLYLVHIVHPVPCSSEYDQMFNIKAGISCNKMSSYLNLKFLDDGMFFVSVTAFFWAMMRLSFIKKVRTTY